MPPPPTPTPSDPAEVRARLERSHAGLVKTIEELASCLDAEFVFEALVSEGLLRLVGGFRESEHGDIPALVELAAFHLYPHSGRNTRRDAPQVRALIDALNELNRMRGIYTAFSVDPTADPELAAMQVHLRLWAEGVRGTAYASQQRRLIKEIHGPFEEWFRAKAGIGPVRALAVILAVADVVDENIAGQMGRFRELEDRRQVLLVKLAQPQPELEALRVEQNALLEEMARADEAAPLSIACSFAQLVRKLPDLSRSEWDGLASLIGLTSASRAGIQAAREIKDRPLYFLSGDRVICAGTSVFDALFEAYDRLTRTDLAFRDRRYVPNLSASMEKEVLDYLRRVFPSSAVFGPLTYPDPDRPGGEAELDAAVSWGPFLVLMEVKGKQFRPRSRLGDPARLRDDLKDNIEEAFEQATRATRHLASRPTVTFAEKGTVRKLVVSQGSLRRVFPISVTLHHFGGLATQLALLKRIGLFRDSAYPWSVSLPDLDVITRFASSPDVFLHYVQRRLDLQRSEANIHGDELDIFGLYLDSRLHPSQFWERKEADGSRFTMMHLTGGSERFDDYFQAELNDEATKSEIRLALPPRFGAIIDGLRRSVDDGARWIAFTLLGLSPQTVERLEVDLEKLRATAPPRGKFLRVTLRDGDVVLSLVMGHGTGPLLLHRQTVFRARLEKYRFKASASLALGLDYGRPSQAFECAIWLDGPWAFDAELEAELKSERPKAFSRAQLPGPNEPCICGSGKKFKKCCRDRISIVPS